MNYLAHLFLAKPTTESLLGNLMGDFVKGTPDSSYSDEVIEGIINHRKIDRFTDEHPVFLESKKLISPVRRKFAGIILDISFDHFLSLHWYKFTSENKESFIQLCYQVLTENHSELPGRLKEIAPRMIQKDWLGSYQNLENISRAIDGVSLRIKRENNLKGGIVEVEQNYYQLEENFLKFFPQLLEYNQFLTNAKDARPCVSTGYVEDHLILNISLSAFILCIVGKNTQAANKATTAIIVIGRLAKFIKYPSTAR